MNVEIGNNLFVSTSPASAYHKMHAEQVEILAVHEHPSEKEENRVYTFIHPTYGPGALHAHGFKSDLNFDLNPGLWRKEESVKKPMFEKFKNQKLTKFLGEVDLPDGRKILTYMHSSLGFISSYAEDFNKDTYIGSR